MKSSGLAIKLAEAKQAINVPSFRDDSKLGIALIDTSTLNESSLPKAEQDALKKQFHRLAYLGDQLIDLVLGDYLFSNYPALTKEDLDDWRQNLACRETLTKFAIKLGLPEFCSSCNKTNRKPPAAEPGIYGEMFEALVAAIYLDGNRDLAKVSCWLCERFIREAVESYNEDHDEDCDTTITTRDFLDLIGLEDFPDYGWAPGDDGD